MGSVRFDKRGRRLEDTGRGCGCQQCADARAPRYERRAVAVTGRRRRWSWWHRRLVSFPGLLLRRRRPDIPDAPDAPAI